MRDSKRTCQVQQRGREPDRFVVRVRRYDNDGHRPRLRKSLANRFRALYCC
jgi:hypothetical protein